MGLRTSKSPLLNASSGTPRCSSKPTASCLTEFICLLSVYAFIITNSSPGGQLKQPRTPGADDAHSENKKKIIRATSSTDCSGRPLLSAKFPPEQSSVSCNSGNSRLDIRIHKTLENVIKYLCDPQARPELAARPDKQQTLRRPPSIG